MENCTLFSALLSGESAEAPSAALLCRSLHFDHAPPIAFDDKKLATRLHAYPCMYNVEVECI